MKRGQALNTEHAQIRFFLDRQREQILADCQAEIRKHEFQADYDRRSKQKLNEKELHSSRSSMNSCSSKTGIYVKLMKKVSVRCGVPSHKNGPPSIWDTHGSSGNVVEDPVASSSAFYPQELNPWSSGRAEPINSSTADKNENRTPVQDQRYQSGQSAKSSVIPSEETLSRILVQTNNDCRSQIFTLTSSLHQHCLLVGR